MKKFVLAFILSLLPGLVSAQNMSTSEMNKVQNGIFNYTLLQNCSEYGMLNQSLETVNSAWRSDPNFILIEKMNHQVYQKAKDQLSEITAQYVTSKVGPLMCSQMVRKVSSDGFFVE
jgi:hypothetical protein